MIIVSYDAWLCVKVKVSLVYKYASLFFIYAKCCTTEISYLFYKYFSWFICTSQYKSKQRLVFFKKRVDITLHIHIFPSSNSWLLDIQKIYKIAHITVVNIFGDSLLIHTVLDKSLYVYLQQGNNYKCVLD